MKRLFGMLLVLASAALASGADDKKDMEGTWELVSLEVDGKPVPAADWPFSKIVVKGDKATFSKGDKAIAETTFSVDPTKKPKTMDATYTMGPNKGEKVLAIYELDGDNLKVCSTQRPKEFSTKEGPKYSLVVWKRVKN
jgi:uncharacterized protein (TIGR03067 family)